MALIAALKRHQNLLFLFLGTVVLAVLFVEFRSFHSDDNVVPTGTTSTQRPTVPAANGAIDRSILDKLRALIQSRRRGLPSLRAGDSPPAVGVQAPPQAPPPPAACTLTEGSCERGGTFNKEICQCECKFDFSGNKCEKTPELLDGYTFWSSDYHISTAGDVKHLFSEMGMNVKDQSLSGACGRVGTCATDLAIINTGNGQTFCPAAHQLRKRFFEHYKQTAVMSEMDAYICSHPPSFCELFMPFGKPIVIYATVNLEFSRENPTRFADWVKNLQAMAKHPRNVIAANNVYDANYIHYFTGLVPVVLPSYCGYVAPASYKPNKDKFLIAKNPWDIKQVQETLNLKKSDGSPLNIATVSSLYSHFEYQDLASHPAIVCFPYTKSVMTYFELYRMNIPMVFPSLDLLTKWDVEEGFLKERIYWKRTPIPSNPPYEFNPNDRGNKEATRYWLQFCDWYQWPHITYFDSMEDLVVKLETTDFQALSEKMKAYNEEFVQNTKDTWGALFRRMFKDKEPGEFDVPDDFDESMNEQYGFTLGPDPPCDRQSAPEHGNWG